jgi:hypothetical protein
MKDAFVPREVEGIVFAPKDSAVFVGLRDLGQVVAHAAIPLVE